MFSLPRGTGPALNVPLYSAAWEMPAAVERLVYQHDGALFLGAIPAGDMWPYLGDMREKAIQAIDIIDRSPRPPLKRAQLVNALETVWRAAQLSETIPLGLNDPRHMITVAGARSGKGRSAIVPNLCLYPGSVLVIDPKGENASITAARRGKGNDWCSGMGQDVYVLDPFGVAEVPESSRAGMNPLALLDLKSDTIIDDVALLADALIVSSGQGDAAHWDESARNFVRGLTLFLVAKRQNPTLFTLRNYLAKGDDEGWRIASKNDPDIKEAGATVFLLKIMQEVKTGNADLDNVIIGAATTLLDCGEKERGSILSTARRNTAFLDSLGKRFRETLAGADGIRLLNPDDLKTKPGGVSVYLCLPAPRMQTHSRWLRVVINLTLERMQRSLKPPVTGAAVLFLLDEFYTLGPMATIENAAGFAAGFGVKLWPVLQDLQQLKALYPNSWQTFLANAAAVQVFGASDAETCEYVSKMLGQIETRQTVANRTASVNTGFGQPSDAQRLAPLVAALGRRQMGLAAAELARVAVTDDISTSGGGNQNIATNESITPTHLLHPDEVAQQFSAESGAALVMIKGRRPIWCLRVDYDTSPWFIDRYTPLAHLVKDGQEPPKATPPFGERYPGTFERCADAFNALTRTVEGKD